MKSPQEKVIVQEVMVKSDSNNGDDKFDTNPRR